MGRFDSGITPEDLQKRSPRPFESPWGTIALLTTPDGPACIQAFCPHMEGPLTEGTVAEGRIVCPWHLWSFSMDDGSKLRPQGGDPCAIDVFTVALGPSGTFLVEPRRSDPGRH